VARKRSLDSVAGLPLADAILHYLKLATSAGKGGLSSSQIRARLPLATSVIDFERALRELRDNALIAHTDGVWWLRRVH